MFYIGCHLSVSEGYEAMGKRALEIGANTFQYFTRNPRGRSTGKAPDSKDVEALVNLIAEHGFAPPLAHAPYTYNVCSKDEEIRKYSAEAMKSELLFLESIPGSMYNFHPGCHVSQGIDVGIEYIAACLNSILSEDMSVTVLLETMAGKGTEIGATFEELAAIIRSVNENVRKHLGVCLDTCHVNDAGYDIAGNTDYVIEEFDKIIGIDRLRAVHLNDSKNGIGARKDRHEKIGSGTLMLEGIERIINHPALSELPFYLETPNELDGYKEEIKLLKSMKK